MQGEACLYGYGYVHEELTPQCIAQNLVRKIVISVTKWSRHEVVFSTYNKVVTIRENEVAKSEQALNSTHINFIDLQGYSDYWG